MLSFAEPATRRVAAIGTRKKVKGLGGPAALLLFCLACGNRLLLLREGQNRLILELRRPLGFRIGLGNSVVQFPQLGLFKERIVGGMHANVEARNAV